MKTIELFEKFAQDIVKQMPKIPELRAILLSGSVAKGLADLYSDIELKFIWEKESTVEQRKNILISLNKKDYFREEFEDGEFYETVFIDSMKFDLSHTDIVTINNHIKSVFEEGSASVNSQTLFGSLLDSKELQGDISDIKKKIEIYPDNLDIKFIQENLIFESWSLREVLQVRKDYMALHHLVDSTLLQILKILFGLNKVYLRSTSFKWLNYQLGLLKVKPENLEQRINMILTSASYKQSIDTLHQVIKDTFRLLKENLLMRDLDYAESIIDYIRKPMNF